MIGRYLFRLDGARENDTFFRRSSSGCRVVYSGTPKKFGPGWIPDLLEVNIISSDGAQLTLIELEADRSVAMVSARKYLPEEPSSVIETFKEYLGTIIKECRRTADSRKEELENLRVFLTHGANIQICAAAALRDSTEFVEVLPLMLQVASSPVPRITHPNVTSGFEAKGKRVLTRREAEVLQRTIWILHAVISGQDDSGASLEAWYKVLSRRNYTGEQFPQNSEMHRLVQRPKQRGLEIDFDKLVEEMLPIWSSGTHSQKSTLQVSGSIETYFPIARAFPKNTRMPTIFQKARRILDGKDT